MAELDVADAGADARALFTIVDEASRASVRVRPSDYTRGPWDHSKLHGGPVGGLVAWAAERLVDPEQDLLCGRLTVELLSAVPLADLDVSATVVKPGRRSTVIDVRVTSGNDVVARANSQWVRPSSTGSALVADPPPRPDRVADPGAGDVQYPRPGFNCDAAELRYVSGSNEESGPSVIWARLTSPLMAGLSTTPLGRIATITDFAAAAGWQEGVGGAAHINPDLTLQLMRYPSGPWIAIDARNYQASGGIGFNDALVYDDDGLIGRILQSLVETSTSPLAAGSNVVP